ncbi:MAG: non-ribosomal peptide synthetase [Acidobacteria bacterium]|nr:non-ribosomal peptide synthetase [Acidobacteriota bacterium]
MSLAPEIERARPESGASPTIAGLFSQQAARSPQAIALIAGNRQVTYLEVDDQSTLLAAYLRSLGVRPGTLVGVAMGRTEKLLISLLAILKAGGAYVPLDPNYPKERLSLVIEDANISVLLTTPDANASLNINRTSIKVIDVNDPSIFGSSVSDFSLQGCDEDLAYVIYTSGSTGKPKGVMIENRNVMSFFRGMDLAIGCEPGTWLAVTSISFDISVLELLWTLTRGFRVVIHADAGSDKMAEEIVRHQVTHLQMTPSLARMLILDDRNLSALGSLRQLLLGGEAVPASLIHHLRREFKGQIFNMYGPTETTIWSTTYPVEEVGASVPIGRPIEGTELHILDSEFRPVSSGEVGELFIAGEGVARGYWERPELTAERFLSLPAITPYRLYRTGDLTRSLPDGNLEYLGRADYQIKLRGHRIEPGEIEAILERRADVAQAVVVLREDREGDKRLVAYLVGSQSVEADIGAIRKSVESELPEYMVPSSFVFLPSLPLTDNGKIDRKALLKLPPPALPAVNTSRPQSESGNVMESLVARVWQEALGIPAVGLEENFFDLGAHSLTVAEVQAKLQSELGCEITLVDLFQYSTVKALAAHLIGKPSRSQLSDRAARRRLARSN